MSFGGVIGNTIKPLPLGWRDVSIQLEKERHMPKKSIADIEYEAKREWEKRPDVPIYRVAMLAQMAELDICPDGRFGDDECAIWSMFRSAYRAGRRDATR